MKYLAVLLAAGAATSLAACTTINTSSTCGQYLSTCGQYLGTRGPLGLVGITGGVGAARADRHQDGDQTPSAPGCHDSSDDTGAAAG